MKKFLFALVAMLAPAAAYGQTATVTGFFDIGEVAVIEFCITNDISINEFLDMTSNGSTDDAGGGGADTELLLFSGFGSGATFVLSDDDDGIGVASTLTFGSGSGLLLGDSFNLGGDGIANGEDGLLAAGDYSLVVGEFPTSDVATLGDVVGGNEAVNFIVDFYASSGAGFSLKNAAIPEPGTAALIALVAAPMVLRRKR